MSSGARRPAAYAITAEATPHHLALTDDCLSGYDTNFKMNPPLRTEADRRALIAGLKDGTLDCISTDHAPHTDYEKDKEFDYAPNGIIGLETALAVGARGARAEEQVQAGTGRRSDDPSARRRSSSWPPARSPPAPPRTSACSTRTRTGDTTPRPARASRAIRRGTAGRSPAASGRRSSTAGWSTTRAASRFSRRDGRGRAEARTAPSLLRESGRTAAGRNVFDRACWSRVHLRCAGPPRSGKRGIAVLPVFRRTAPRCPPLHPTSPC